MGVFGKELVEWISLNTEYVIISNSASLVAIESISVRSLSMRIRKFQEKITSGVISGRKCAFPAWRSKRKRVKSRLERFTTSSSGTTSSISVLWDLSERPSKLLEVGGKTGRFRAFG